MLRLWVPLAASIVMMVLEPSIVNIGLGRSARPELALGAYGVAYSLALLVEAPILMLIDASVARSSDRSAFLMLRRFTVYVGLAVTAVGLVASATPLYGWIVGGLMRIPADVAAEARPTLIALSFWPFPIGWRRTYQGLLIRTARTGVITTATAVRLIVLAAVMFGGLALLPHEGALVAGVAMVVSVAAEAGLITWAAGPILRSAPYAAAGAEADGQAMRALWRFYRPLLITSLLRQSTRPLLSAGIAAALLVRPSLAAWPVTWGLAILVAGPAWSLQQLTTALAVDRQAFRPVHRFSLGLSLAFTGLLALIAFTPLYGPVMGGVYNLSPEIQDLARPATQVLVPLPLLFGLQSTYRGALIRHGCTPAVRSATVVSLLVLGAALAAGVLLLPMSGVLLAASATMLGNLAELAWLRRENPLCRPTA